MARRRAAEASPDRLFCCGGRLILGVRAATPPQIAYKSGMKPCVIFHVSRRGSFAWKWRHSPAAGRTIESKEEYALYYDCVSAALRQGYLPEMKCFLPGDAPRAAA
jgi:hypothetical protein